VQLTFDADVEAFRAEFVAFLDQHLPPEAEALDRSWSSSHVPDWARRWQRLMFDSGWLVPGNPAEFGGRNATILQQYAYQLELSRRRVYQTYNPQGVGIIAASLISYGTGEQQQKWAVPILRAEMTASLGMSEPGAGSDLASLRTRAVRDGDSFVVNGQKVWTSGAHDADVLLAFVRTDPDAPKHKGITYFLLDMKSPGIEIRPLREITGDSLFNEVFLDNVFVPDEMVVGTVNDGWRLARTTLANERIAMAAGTALGNPMEELLAAAAEADLDAAQQDRLARLIITAQVGSLLDQRIAQLAVGGQGPGSESSVRKLIGVRYRQELAEFRMDLTDGAGVVEQGKIVHDFLNTRCLTIAGGTEQILLTVAAERLLGLPR
jgi:3-oxochol-4-en-24-oyl-CoA dehydrogenase